MNFLGQKNLPMRKLFLYFNSWLSGIKLWLLEEVFGKVVKKLLYVSLRTISMKKLPIENFILFHSLQLNRKKINFRKTIFGNVVKTALYVCSRTISGKQFFWGKKFNFISFGTLKHSLFGCFWKKNRKSYLHWILLVECNVIAEIFLSEI